jgi:hypothetical protein
VLEQKRKDIEELIKKASSADEEAYAQLYQEYKRAVRGYIAARCFWIDQKRIKDLRNESDIDHGIKDIEQETWLEIRNKLPSYNPAKGHFFASKFTPQVLESLKCKNIIREPKERQGGERFLSWAVSTQGELEAKLAEADITDIEEILHIWKVSQWQIFYHFICNWARFIVKRHIPGSREINISDYRYRCESSGEEENDEELLDRIHVKTEYFESEEVLKRYALFTRMTFSQGGPPHQVIVFGFNKLITGWGPQEIVKELSPRLLLMLSEQLILSYKEESSLPEYAVRECFEPLKKKMDIILAKVLEDEVSKKTYIDLLNIKVGETILKDYYNKEPAHNISDWSYKVRQRVLKILKKSSTSREKE